MSSIKTDVKKKSPPRPEIYITALAACFTTLLMSGAAVGQSAYGAMYGSFTDASGVPVAGARVTVTSQGRGGDLTTTTNEFGKFQVTGLLPDTYTIRVEEDGFKTFRETEIPVVADETSRVSGILTKGEPTTFITGTPGKIDILKTDRTDVSSLFTRRTIEGLPLRDLNVSHLGLLVPGSLPAILRLDPNQNPQNGTPINVNGQSFSGTGFQLDGTDNRDPLLGLMLINPNLESVNEMKVTTQNYGADFGEATAGVISIQTRSGTNSWHGSAFDSRRTDWGQARNPFSTPPPRLKHNDFGGSIGGPLVKNKLFVFSDYQGTRQATHFNRFRLNVPTELVHRTCVGGPSGFCDLSEYLSVGQVYDPNRRMSYAPDQVPNSALNLGAVGLLRLLPLPNAGNPGDIVKNFVATGTRIVGADRFDTRVDLSASRKLKLLARYSLANFRDDGSPAFGKVAGGPGANPAGFAGRNRTHNQGLSSGFVYSVTPTLLTDFRFGFFRYHLNLDSFDLGTTPALSIANTPGLNYELFSSGLPDIELRERAGTDYLRFGYSPPVNSCNCPFREDEQRFQWVTNWMKTFGKHAFKWGADIRYYENFRLTSDHRRAGHLMFNPETTSDPINGQGGLSLATFLFGAVSDFDRLYDPDNPPVLNAGERQKRWFFYDQDTWRVTPRLTINYGLRWEIYFPQTVTADRAGGFLIPNFKDPKSSVFNVPGEAGVDRSGKVRQSLTNLGPRFGIAYLIQPKTVIRAGYGRGFDVGFAGSNFGISATQNPPVMIFQQSVDSAPPSPPVFFLGDRPPTFAFPPSPFSIGELANAILDDRFSVPSVYAVPARIRLPTVDAWNFTVQRQLSSTMYFEVGYVGNKGTHVPPDGTFQPANYDLNQATLKGYITSRNSNNCKDPSSVEFCLSKAVSRKPFRPWSGPVRYFGNDSSNNYNSLQATLNKSFSHGYEFLAHYTWGKALDYESSYFNVEPRKAKMGYGPADFDRSHAFVLANLWSLPVGRGKSLLAEAGPIVDRIVGGWSLNAVTVWYSGLPFSPSYNTDACGRDRDTGPCRPNVIGDVHIIGKRKEWFTTTGGILFAGPYASSFDSSTGIATAGTPVGPWQEPAPGQFGNAGRNSLRGPGFFQSDIAISKDIAFTERISLRFRADVFNVFNRANLGNPNPCVDCPNAARIQQLAPGAFQRQWQFSLKLQF
jgi:carboxypeptidase family protein/TonB-dependent receptor-like protein